MNSKIATIGLFGVLMVAAFAGIAYIGEDASAEPQVLKYTVGTTVYSETVDTETVTLKDLADLGYTIPEGKTFRGWASADPASVTPTTIYSAGSTYALSTGLTLYAVIESVTYIVTFSYLDGTAIMTKDNQTYDATLTLPAKATAVAASKVLEFDADLGMVFIGWARSDAPETVVIAESEKTVRVTGDADYVAVYAHDPVLTFIVDGTQIYKHTEYKAVLPTAPSKDGFTFVGWSDGVLTIRDADLSTYVSLLVDDVVLTAVWEPAVYTVTFVVDGETVLEQSVKHGDAATEPKFTPAKDGFDFVCWSIDGNAAYDFGIAVTGDLTITAVFKQTPAPAPTGLKDPTMQMMLVIIGTLVVALIALGVWKRDAIRAGLVKKLDKGKKGNGGDGAA